MADYSLGGIEVTEDSVHVYGSDGEELVMWIKDEWVEDPSVVLSIVNCVRMFYDEGPDAVARTLGRG